MKSYSFVTLLIIHNTYYLIIIVIIIEETNNKRMKQTQDRNIKIVRMYDHTPHNDTDNKILTGSTNCLVLEYLNQLYPSRLKYYKK